MVKRIVCSLVLALSLFAWSFSIETSAQTFKDVPSSKEYYEAVEMLVEKGAISKGEKFNPSNNVTRGQLSKIMAIILELDTTNVKNPKFKDVPTTHQFYPYIAALAQEGIISGYSDGTFGVNKKVTRGHMAKFIVNGFGFQKSMPVGGYFDDHGIDKNGMPVDGYENAYTLKFYDITNASSFGLSKPVKRSHIALFLQRAIQAKELDERATRYSFADTYIGSNITQYSHYFSELNQLKVKVDLQSDELYFTAVNPGEYAYIAAMPSYMNDRIKLRISVDEALNIKVKKVGHFEKGFEVPFRYNVYAKDSYIKSYEYRPLAINPSESPVVHRTRPEGYDYFFIQSTLDGEVIELTIKYMNGKTEKRYVHSFLYDSVVYNREMKFFDKSFEIDLNTTYKAKLISGDATGVKIVDNPEATSTYVDEKLIFTKPGLYVFDMTFTKYVFKIGEYNGKLFAAYEMY